MNEIAEDILMHYGMKYRSGRYPYGSGENPYQHDDRALLAESRKYAAQGLSTTDIAHKLGMSSTEYRTLYRLARINERNELREQALKLVDEGKNPSEIARIMGYPNESSVRQLLNVTVADKQSVAGNVAERLKEELKTKKMLDVGDGTERTLGVSQTQLDSALFILQKEGYSVENLYVPYATDPNHGVTIKTLAPPDMTYADMKAHKGDISYVGEFTSTDGGRTFTKRQYPASLDSSRIKIRYAEEGGISKDGTIEIRKDAADLSLGSSHYAQVRILVDGTHYMKGMAMYSDGKDMPDGVDIIFNTNKKTGTDLHKVLKPIKNDPDDPFGAYIKANGQSYYIDKNGEKKLSVINKLKEEGEWDTESSKNLSQQFLSKQTLKLIEDRLDEAYSDKKRELSEYQQINNPTVRIKFLNDFAESCDKAAVDLRGAALPRQKTEVILPLDDIKQTEVYAPNYENGEKIALIRYPHAGPFEIPILTVNNKNKSGNDILGNDIKDAIGINSKVAEQLSGADFDGDTVVCLPINSLSTGTKIVTAAPLEELKDFSTNDYAFSDDIQTKIDSLRSQNKSTKEINKALGIKLMDEKQKGREMGIVSNLITDMTVRGAPIDDIAKAVKHSMVVIDAVKHELDYTKSEQENEIPRLKKEYQIKITEDGEIKYGGASTLLSRRKNEVEVPERQGAAKINKDTGEVNYTETHRKYYDKKGNLVDATTKIPIMEYYPDAHALSSGTDQEELYADYANNLKALANEARKEAANTIQIKYNPEAKAKYEDQVISLNSKYKLAVMNKPLERQAQVIANEIIKEKIAEDPSLSGKDSESKKQLSKVRRKAIDEARNITGANGKETRIKIDEKEWEAIQNGAISSTFLQNILSKADSDNIKELALPKESIELSQAKQNKITSMQNSGYSISDIAKALSISTSTVSKYLK